MGREGREGRGRGKEEGKKVSRKIIEWESRQNHMPSIMLQSGKVTWKGFSGKG